MIIDFNTIGLSLPIFNKVSSFILVFYSILALCTLLGVFFVAYLIIFVHVTKFLSVQYTSIASYSFCFTA